MNKPFHSDRQNSNRQRVAYKAFVASGIAVALAIPVSIVLRDPNLASLVLVVTGAIAVIVAREHLQARVLKSMSAIVLLVGALLVVHLNLHRLALPHEWLELISLAAIVSYCALTLPLGFRLIGRVARPT